MPTNYHNLIRGCGFSGTDASLLEISRGLARQGHGVRVLSGGPASKETIEGDSGVVEYLSPEPCFLNSADRLEDLARVDVFVVVYMTCDAHPDMLDVLKRLTNPRLKVFLWCHSIYTTGMITVLESACMRRQTPFMLVGVSEFVRTHLAARRAKCVIIPNAINPSIFNMEQREVREPLSFVFCASYERGGHIAEEVHKLLKMTLPMGAMYVSSYCDPALGPSLSKIALASRMRSSDYMVYPLVLGQGAVHHDTYACVILEAMACGVLVVTWDVACLRGVYGDLITLVPPPEFPGYDPGAEFGTNGAMLRPAAISALADAVSLLANLPVGEREAIRMRARTWAVEQTWDKRVTALLSEVEQLDLIV